MTVTVADLEGLVQALGPTRVSPEPGAPCLGGSVVRGSASTRRRLVSLSGAYLRCAVGFTHVAQLVVPAASQPDHPGEPAHDDDPQQVPGVVVTLNHAHPVNPVGIRPVFVSEAAPD